MYLHNREEINTLIAQATEQDCITQYVAFEKVRKILAHHHVFLPKVFLDKPDNYIAIPVTRFGEKIGMTNDGKFKKEDEDDEFVLYFEWYQNENGLFTIFTEIVDDEELADLVNDYNRDMESLNEESTVTMNIPLLLRMLEYSREDAKKDEDLHTATENMIKQNGKVLSMKDYLSIIKKD